MCFDNVGIEEIARHQGTKNKTVHIWTSAFAVQNRVHADLEEEPLPRIVPTELPLHTFLPQEMDQAKRRDRMVVIVQRILESHLPYFEGCDVDNHILHKHSDEMAKKSKAVTIGIIPVNPGTTDGNMTVLDELHKYVPFPSGRMQEPAGIPVHGDAASVLGMLKAKRTRSGMGTPAERLEGIWPIPGEFHRRMLLNQDSMNILYRPESQNDKGTLSEVKNKFQLKGVKTKVTDAFNHVEDMFSLTTKGLICLVAMKLLNIRYDAKPTKDDEALQEKFSEVAEKVVTFFWHQTPMTDVMTVIEADTASSTSVFCKCGKHIGKDRY